MLSAKKLSIENEWIMMTFQQTTWLTTTESENVFKFSKTKRKARKGEKICVILYKFLSSSPFYYGSHHHHETSVKR